MGTGSLSLLNGLNNDISALNPVVAEQQRQVSSRSGGDLLGPPPSSRGATRSGDLSSAPIAHRPVMAPAQAMNQAPVERLDITWRTMYQISQDPSTINYSDHLGIFNILEDGTRETVLSNHFTPQQFADALVAQETLLNAFEAGYNTWWQAVQTAKYGSEDGSGLVMRGGTRGGEMTRSARVVQKGASAKPLPEMDPNKQIDIHDSQVWNRLQQFDQLVKQQFVAFRANLSAMRVYLNTAPKNTSSDAIFAKFTREFNNLKKLQELLYQAVAHSPQGVNPWAAVNATASASHGMGG